MDPTAQPSPAEQTSGQGSNVAENTSTPAALSDPSHGVLAWRTVAASVIGVSHQRSGHPLQDAYAYEILADGTVISIVADGAGSAARAEHGSALAVQSALAAVTTQLAHKASASAMPHAEIDWGELLSAAFKQARMALESEAAAQHAPLRDYATTMLVLVITEACAACALIGDCVAVIQKENGELCSPCAPQKGEYANMTHFLTQEQALEWLDIQVIQGVVHRAAILSDGLLELALNVAQNRPHAPFFAPLFAFAHAAEDEEKASADLAQFLASERINSRTHDDKTLILLSRDIEERRS